MPDLSQDYFFTPQFILAKESDIVGPWKELLEGQYFEQLAIKIHDAKSEALYSAGLWGSQLALKLMLVKDWAKKWATEKSKEVLKNILKR